MSLYIKDLEMPSDCIECKMSYDGGSHCLLVEDDNDAVLGGKMWRRCPLSGKRPEWCPLVEIVRCNECEYYQGVRGVPGHAPCDFWECGAVMWNNFCSSGVKLKD